ncbi:MAG TPA: MarR family transcriptional regulator [Janthinobacterium sp.]|nr:MarR family transcriptional regulator [Janthinobacterium sp.]
MTQETITFPSDALAVCLRLARAHALIAARLDDQLGLLHGIGYGDFQLLRQLSLAPRGRLGRAALATSLALTAAGVTRALLPLEKIGLLARQQDAPGAHVTLTPAGRALASEAAETAHPLCQRLLGAAPLAVLADGLERVAGMVAPRV